MNQIRHESIKQRREREASEHRKRLFAPLALAALQRGQAKRMARKAT